MTDAVHCLQFHDVLMVLCRYQNLYERDGCCWLMGWNFVQQNENSEQSLHFVLDHVAVPLVAMLSAAALQWFESWMALGHLLHDFDYVCCCPMMTDALDSSFHLLEIAIRNAPSFLHLAAIAAANDWMNAVVAPVADGPENYQHAMDESTCWEDNWQIRIHWVMLGVMD